MSLVQFLSSRFFPPCLCCCFNKLPLCASFIESAAARCCRCCCRCLHLRRCCQLQLRLTCIQCGLKASKRGWGGVVRRPREIGMLQHLCQCQHCQDVRVCHFARCVALQVASCLFCVLQRLNATEIFKEDVVQATPCNGR